MRLAIVGAGYVGLVSGACFAELGHSVVCVDRDASKIDRLRRSVLPIYEPGLESVVAANQQAGRLAFTTEMAEALDGADAVFIAVGTPPGADGHADLSHVYAAAREIALGVDRFVVVVTKSTVPVGTGDAIERILAQVRPDLDAAVVSNPEFLREGAAIADFMQPDRIVVGLNDERARPIMEAIYAPHAERGVPVLVTNRRTAEVIKYAANAFLATKVGFINQIADFCERVEADVQEVSRGIGLDRRIGPNFLQPGPGYGGSCFPKDALALVRSAGQAGTPLTIIDAVIAANDARKRRIARTVISAIGGSGTGRRVAVLGLAFKPNTDDMREAPSIAIIQGLVDAGAKVVAYDPVAMPGARSVLPGEIDYAEDPYSCAAQADAVVLVTEWDEFRSLDLGRIHAAMRGHVLVDLRNVFHPADMTGRGFHYLSVGRPPVMPEPAAEALAARTA